MVYVIMLIGIVLSSDPLKDIRNIKDIEMVINNGKIVDRNKILSN